MATINLSVFAQGYVTGGFVGRVLDADGNGIPGATITFLNQKTGSQVAAKADEKGGFSKTSMPPGIYDIEAKADGYEPKKQTQALLATKPNEVVPVPFSLVKINANPNPTLSPTTTPVDNSKIAEAVTETDLTISLNPRRDGAFNETSIMNLPLGGTTLTRTFDELAFLVPGVNPPPQAIGNSVGPGVGGGVGTSGQFSVNGLRSRANNFTVDGSDNNDEDIGVRRQGFFTLVPQPIESIQEFQIITLLAPAEFGRNLGAQVNALSKSGGNRFSGSIFGLFSSSRLNSRTFFDNASGNTTIPLTGRNFFTGADVPVEIDRQRQTVINYAGEKDSSTLFQGGFAIGGPIVRNKAFFFVSGEGQVLNAVKETNFAVPTVEQRGLFGRGATGLCAIIAANPCPTGNPTANGSGSGDQRLYPNSLDGDSVFSLFPFPNNPTVGIYGRNTFTQELSADARGIILSGKLDWNIFKVNENQQVFTARYNFTDDRRDLTDVGGAIFSAVRPLVRTNNISTFLTGSLTDNVSNEFRFSWGQTQLNFEELRDPFLLPISSSLITNAEDRRFLLNARRIVNFTLPTVPSAGCNPNVVCYKTFGPTQTQSSNLGLIGQLIIGGFSPIGVDVFNFPQERKNNTFQFADNLRWQKDEHSLTFGTDIRFTSLDSDLPRNARPLVTFYGSQDLSPQNPAFYAAPTDLAAAGAATGFFQSLVLAGQDARIKLKYSQWNFFAQDEWRVNSKTLVSFGVRYEFNTPPKEVDNKIESAFGQTLPARVADLARFIDGRDKIFESDKNNFAVRLGIATAMNSKTVVRAGFGMYYDQILGAVVSQSRNVFPTFTTINFGGGNDVVCVDNEGDIVDCDEPGAIPIGIFFSLFNPLNGVIGPNRIIQSGTLNTLNPVFVSGSTPMNTFLNSIYNSFPYSSGTPFGATYPTKKLDTPFSYQYSFGVEGEVFDNNFLSVAYVGTTGKSLLRFTTPNLGTNYIATVLGYFRECVPDDPNAPCILGTTEDPNRPVPGIGPISQFETTGRSQYHSFQVALRGRLNGNFQYQMNYVYGTVKDDVSDVFDLAGAFALPQNSLTFEGEYAPANFDVRHRFTYNFIYDLPGLRSQSNVVRYLFGGWQIAGTGKFNTGQPFTVNSIFDINMDGNLTDRLNNTQFITETGDRRQPLQLSCTGTQCQSMLAPFGQDGDIPRNSFRAGNLLELDLSFSKRFTIREDQNLQFRVDVFNFINRANFGVPVRLLESPSFGQATDTVTPGRRIQFMLRYNF